MRKTTRKLRPMRKSWVGGALTAEDWEYRDSCIFPTAEHLFYLRFGPIAVEKYVSRCGRYREIRPATILLVLRYGFLCAERLAFNGNE
jgi:hypothetical protein